MKWILIRLKPSKILACSFFVFVIFCSQARAYELPAGWTLLADRNFVGTVTNFTYSGVIQNAGEIPVGSQVGGHYWVAYDPNSDPVLPMYQLTSDVTMQGVTGSYDSTIPSNMNWASWSLSPDNQNIHYVWANGFPTGLFDLYFTSATGADGGRATVDINDFASDVFSGTGTFYYETFLNGSGFASFSMSYTMSSVPEAVPEPSTLLLAAGGLAALFAARRAKRQQ